MKPGPTADAPAAREPLGWAAEKLRFAYPGTNRAAVDDVTLGIEGGRCTAILGPNGSGKSTLLRLLLGTLRPSTGTARLGGREVGAWSRRDLARTVGVVPQNEEIAFPLTVRELVAMGRYPHLGAFRPEGPADREAIDAALARCDVAGLRDRYVETLSGGERQRARLARSLAQDPRVLALDEPTLALDVRHEMEIFELMRSLTAGGVTVLLITHNLNLAARYADALVLMENGRVAAAGAPSGVLRRDVVEPVYAWPLLETRHPGPGRDAGAPQATPLAVDVGDLAHGAANPFPGSPRRSI